jgi:hypothetical protein
MYNSLIVDCIANAGGGVSIVTAYNCTISGCSASFEGGGLRDSTIYNTISWGNTPADHNVSAFFSCGAGFTNNGSFTNDPLFVSAGDLHLQPGSPCINTGTNGIWTVGDARDLAGNPRVWTNNGTVDMGAYEYGSYLVTLVLYGNSVTAIRGSNAAIIRGYVQ